MISVVNMKKKKKTKTTKKTCEQQGNQEKINTKFKEQRE